MGEVSGRLSDLTILTSDNPRWEDPETIINDIETGVRKTAGRISELWTAGKRSFGQCRWQVLVIW